MQIQSRTCPSIGEKSNGDVPDLKPDAIHLMFRTVRASFPRVDWIIFWCYFRSSLIGLITVFAQAFSLQIDTVGVVDDAIEDGIGDGGIADDVMPFVDRQLAGDQDRADVVAILDDFEEIASLIGIEGFRSPIVDNEELDLGDRFQHAGITTVAARKGECREQAVCSMIDCGEIVATGFVAKGAGEIAFADTGRSCDEQVTTLADPVIGGEFLEEASIEATGCSIVDILDTRCLPEFGGSKASFEAFLLA